jgi:stalled ribosome alternative rescue factor ArfA
MKPGPTIAIRRSAGATALANRLFAQRIVRAKKGKGSYSRKKALKTRY